MGLTIRILVGTMTGTAEMVAQEVQQTLEASGHHPQVEMMDNLDRAQRLAHMGSYTRDLRTDHSQWSAEMCRIFGVDPETFVPSSENFLHFVLPEDHAKILATNEHPIRGIGPDEFEYRIRRTDGAIRHIHRINELIRDRSGKVIGLGDENAK